MDPDLDPGSFFQFSVIERWGILGITHELKELRMNVYDMFWRVRTL